MAEEVVRDILWTDSAQKSFKKIIDYLEKNWTEKEVANFVNETVYLLSNIKRQPEMCRPSLLYFTNEKSYVVVDFQPLPGLISVDGNFG